MKKQLIISLLTILFSTLYANSFNVKGTVVDSIGEAESFATIRVYTRVDSIKPVALGTADIDGHFDISLAGAGEYRVNINSVGKQPIDRLVTLSTDSPTVNIGTIHSVIASTALEEITIVASKPLVSKEIDRIGYDVQADEDSKTLQLDEMLKRVPMVSVDPDGTIRVKGSTSFKVYKNGRPNNSFSRNAKEIFKAIPASMIKKIEVITDPGAREDAEGSTAILNIVTLENSSIKGIMANADINWTNSSYIPNGSLWLSGQVDKVTVSSYFGYNHLAERISENNSISTQVYHDTGNTRKTETTSKSRGDITWFGLEGSWEPDSLNLLTAEFGGYYYNLGITLNRETTTMTDAAGNIISGYVSNSIPGSKSSYFDINGSLNYQHSTRHKGETITLSYMISTTNQSQKSLTAYSDMFNMPVPYSGINNRFNLNFIEHTGQVDWERPLTQNHKFNVGAKYIYRQNHSKTTIDYIDFDNTYSNFIHLTQVGAAYADYRFNYGRWGARAGVRYEYSRLDATYKDGSQSPFGSSLNDFVPNAAISFNISSLSSLRLGYSNRISRPGISYLNPALNETPSTVFQGNPNLKSARIQELSINYSYMSLIFNLDLTASYRFTNNAIISVNDIIGEITYSGYQNQGKNRDLYFSVFGRWNINRNCNLSLNGNITRVSQQNSSLNIQNAGWNGWWSLRYSHNLPWKLRLSAGLSSWLGNSSLYNNTRLDGWSILNHNIAIQRSFLKEDRLTIRLMAQNPFGPAKKHLTSTTVNLPGVDAVTRTVSNDSRLVAFSVGYRFGSINAQVKKAAKAIANDDLDGRKQ